MARRDSQCDYSDGDKVLCPPQSGHRQIRMPARYYAATSIGECDPKKAGERRGCCAEAPDLSSAKHTIYGESTPITSDEDMVFRATRQGIGIS